MYLQLKLKNFSQLNILRPFDDEFDEAMDNTAIDLMEYVDHAKIAFVYQDCINIACSSDEFFKGDELGLVSTCASKAAASLNHYMEGFFSCKVRRQHISLSHWEKNCCDHVLNHALYWFLIHDDCSNEEVRRLIKGLSHMEKLSMLENEEYGVDEVEAHMLGRVIYAEDRPVRLSEMLEPETYLRLVTQKHITDNQCSNFKYWVIETPTKPLNDYFKESK